MSNELIERDPCPGLRVLFEVEGGKITAYTQTEEGTIRVVGGKVPPEEVETWISSHTEGELQAFQALQ